MTNSERMVTLCQAFSQPFGEAKADWEIFAEVGRRLGFADKFPFQTSELKSLNLSNLLKGVCVI
jgi:ferredoxin-nitrate reductase